MEKQTNHNWIAIQKEYDKGISLRALKKLYKISSRTIELAIKRNDFEPRKKGNCLTKTSKICLLCKKEKLIEEFWFKRTKRQPYCKVCASEKNKIRYNEHKKEHIAKVRNRNKKFLEEIRLKIAEILKSGCLDCGEKNILVLEFDHRDPLCKVTEVTKMINRGYSWKRTEEEISKCDIRCANCHRAKTAKEQNSWRLQYL